MRRHAFPEQGLDGNRYAREGGKKLGVRSSGAASQPGPGLGKLISG
ncbi:MAG: hypothetical protein WBE37_22985 [Bryobacteraceae bacterium]